ncbi:hypothetical protein BpHYR1_040680 [Brachionus plicatilis]|uniref:Uncharacterized protein n=1 Tax=Brachionus plicatilis TaxID=10195 RepID=A0A3M7STI7_BRAPC|nr:hypothetical protein BpHYR1_040680 [Brachionus plicatilis]
MRKNSFQKKIFFQENKIEKQNRKNSFIILAKTSIDLKQSLANVMLKLSLMVIQCFNFNRRTDSRNKELEFDADLNPMGEMYFGSWTKSMSGVVCDATQSNDLFYFKLIHAK